MLLGLFDAHQRHEVAPRADDARREALVDEILKSLVGGIEILGANAGVVLLPTGKPASFAPRGSNGCMSGYKPATI